MFKSINSTDWLIIWHPNGNLHQQSLAWISWMSGQILESSWKSSENALVRNCGKPAFWFAEKVFMLLSCLNAFNSWSMCGFHKGTCWPWRVEIFPIAMFCWGFLQWKKSFQMISYIMTQFCRIVVIRVTISTIELIWTMVVLIWTGFQLKPLCPKWADEIWTQSGSEREYLCVLASTLWLPHQTRHLLNICDNRYKQK